MKKVLFTQDLGVERLNIGDLLKELNLQADWSLVEGTSVNNPENIIAISTANIPLDRDLLSQFENLKTISMSFTGYDHVDKEYCHEKGISVYNVPAYSTNSVAELGVGLAISLLRQIPKGDQEVKNQRWNENLQGFELAGKKCGIIGTGTIGCRLGELLKSFDCELYAWSRSEKDKFKKLGGIYQPLNDLCSNVDILFVTIALTDETRDLILEEQFSLMKPMSYLVNVARGPIVNRDALISTMNNDGIAGVALDVYDYEPLTTDDELRNLKNAILTPHIAYRTQEALERKALITIENIKRGLENDTTNQVI